MTPQDDDDHDTLVERLTNGFGALLEQVQELADKNQKLEQRLARIRQEVTFPPTSFSYSEICETCHDETR